jgi:hypothetical protein
MPGARPSTFRKPGGFLNNVDGMITGYEFTTEFPGADPNRPKKSDFNSLYFVLSVRQDGADEDVTTTLWGGSADDFEISDDGKTITPIDGRGLGGTTDVARFIESLCVGGFPETNLPEDTINFEAIIGTRVRFIQVPQTDKNGKPLMRKATSGKYKGKEFPQTATQVSHVLDLPKVAAKSNGKSAKPNGKAAVVTSKANGKGTPMPDVADLAASTLLDILSNADDNSVPKAKLRMKVFAALGTKHPQRDEVIKYLYDDDNLVGMDGISYEPSDKSQLISLA